MVWGLGKVGGARRWPLLVLCAGLLLGILGTASAFAAGGPGRVRVGHAPPVARSARDIGGLAAATRMHVTVILKVRDTAGLADYAKQVSTPGSPVYHAYLTPAEFGERFGAAPSQIQALEASMRAHGLTPGAVAANRLSIPLSGSAAQVEHAFSVSFRRHALPEGKVAVVASAAPAFDANVAHDVQAVDGLSSVSPPKPLLQHPAKANAGLRPRLAAKAAPRAASACPAAQSSAASQGAYTADQIAAAYRFSNLYTAGAEGQGQTIAIYELESYDRSDIQAYQSCYGTAASVSNVSVDGGAGSGAGSGEAALDIEQAIGLAPKARYLVYEGPNSNQASPGSGPYDTLNAIVSQDVANVVSISWGQCEQLQGSDSVSAESSLFEEAAAQGQSIVSATGDEGSEDCNAANGLPDPEQAVDDPGSQPFVTGVGGTTLSSMGPPPSETVWNHLDTSGGPLVGGAGGGGVSHAWAMPGYQRDAASSLHVIGTGSSGSPCNNNGGYCRQVPDVAADADPATGYITYWSGGWGAVGGTSAGAPLWAALLADANSSSACHGSAIGFANPALYAAAGAGYGSYFNDITSGNNDLSRTNGGLYPAGSGYDMASGLGTPNAANLAGALCADSLRVNNPGTQYSTLGRGVKLRITTSVLPGAKLSFYPTNLPPGLSLSKTTGRITGKPKRIGTWVVGVAAVDQHLSFDSGPALRAAFFTWKVGGPPKVSQTSLSGVANGRPSLALTISSGRRAPLLKALTLRLPRGLSFGPPARKVTVTGVHGKRLRFSARLVRGRLQITLARSSPRIRVTIRYAAIKASGALAARVRRRNRPALKVSVQTRDASGQGVGEQARIRPRG